MQHSPILQTAYHPGFLTKQNIQKHFQSINHEKNIAAISPDSMLSFDCNGNSAENDKYYISNIKITKY